MKEVELKFELFLRVVSPVIAEAGPSEVLRRLLIAGGESLSRESRFDERNLAVTSDGAFDGAASPFRSSSGGGSGGGGGGGCDRDHRGGGSTANGRGYVDADSMTLL